MLSSFTGPLGLIVSIATPVNPAFCCEKKKILLTNQLGIGYFQVPKTLTFKTRLSGKPFL